jgi:hypothetical protein
MTKRNFTLTAAALGAMLGATPSLAQQAAPAQQTAPAPQADANNADNCQSAPKGAAPQGKHWYYRTDRSVGRKCWYLGEAGAKTITRQAAQPKASTADAQPASQKDLDARAEAPEQPAAKPSRVKPPAPEAATATEPSEPAATPATPDGIASAPLLTQQWPDADAFRPSQTTGAATPLANSQPATLQPAPPQAASPAPAASPPPAVQPAAATPVQNTALSNPPASLSSWGTMLGALLVALGFAGVLGFVTFRYFGRTENAARNMPAPRRDFWGDGNESTASMVPSYDQMIAPSRWASAARASLEPQDLDEIEQLLRRAALEPAPANTNSRADPAARARTPTDPSAVHASAAQRAGSSRPR